MIISIKEFIEVTIPVQYRFLSDKTFNFHPYEKK